MTKYKIKGNQSVNQYDDYISFYALHHHHFNWHLLSKMAKLQSKEWQSHVTHIQRCVSIYVSSHTSSFEVQAWFVTRCRFSAVCEQVFVTTSWHYVKLLYKILGYGIIQTSCRAAATCTFEYHKGNELCI